MSTESGHGGKKPKVSPRDDERPELTDETLDQLSGGPRQQTLDHIGNFNFKVEIEGVTQGAIQAYDDPAYKVRKPD